MTHAWSPLRHQFAMDARLARLLLCPIRVPHIHNAAVFGMAISKLDPPRCALRHSVRVIAALLLAVAVVKPSLGEDTAGNECAEAKTIQYESPETLSCTRHHMLISGNAVRYVADAGNLIIRDDKNTPIASLSYVAYVRDIGKHGSARPVTFVYNGGPGASSIGLHMGAFGPKHVLMNGTMSIPAAPYRLVDNDDSLLDATDLVFIDPVGTGWSHALGTAKSADFWGVDQDVDAFGKFIWRYISVNNRWNSPKFLMGESYGTTRSAALVNHLQSKGMAFNGVILLSSILNYAVEIPGGDRDAIGSLPTFAAIAWYHHKLPRDRPDFDAFIQEVRSFAIGEYAQALAPGQNRSSEETQVVAEKLHRYTGLSVDFLLRSNLRLDDGRFRKELLRTERRTVGRFDGRFLGIDADAAGELPESDASDSATAGAINAAFNIYAASELKVRGASPYIASDDQIRKKWDWKHMAPGSDWTMPLPSVIGDLGNAMRTNPHLKVFAANGYYDLATPFFSTEYDLSHMDLDPQLLHNLSYGYYHSGHMIYLNPEALHLLKNDLARFYASAIIP